MQDDLDPREFRDRIGSQPTVEFHILARQSLTTSKLRGRRVAAHVMEIKISQSSPLNYQIDGKCFSTRDTIRIDTLL